MITLKKARNRRQNIQSCELRIGVDALDASGRALSAKRSFCNTSAKAEVLPAFGNVLRYVL